MLIFGHETLDVMNKFSIDSLKSVFCFLPGTVKTVSGIRHVRVDEVNVEVNNQVWEEHLENTHICLVNVRCRLT